MNGNHQAIKKVKLNRVSFDDVKRTQLKKNNTTAIRGVSNWKPMIDDNTGQNFVVSNHYNPNLHVLDIFFYENDPMMRQKMYSNVPLQYTSITYDSLFWRGERDNFTADKWGSASWGLKSWWSGTPSIPPAGN
jgi:hypothetical protein